MDRDGDDRGAERRQDRPELADALGVGTATAADVDDLTDLQDVPSVEGPGSHDVVDGAAEALEDELDRRGLGPAARSARPRR